MTGYFLEEKKFYVLFFSFFLSFSTPLFFYILPSTCWVLYYLGCHILLTLHWNFSFDNRKGKYIRTNNSILSVHIIFVLVSQNKNHSVKPLPCDLTLSLNPRSRDCEWPHTLEPVQSNRRKLSPMNTNYFFSLKRLRQ